ncbi:outer membrane beta-barrel protein [Flavobacterium aquicola]|uniref:Outer membrane protein with beta-barrel domain n=1 Tax=Flavobacterium aquicola TaxID=1682742 RepID=A0A3E0EAM1_9FLAO|nr:outer membrane beta-barrel protein [Flavobacterium aquicola]REG94066.1 outer membrane protein with beta-barrel domain [Flavobacterium aquicola]
MKKIILTAVAVLAFGFANAQEKGFTKGDLFISGAVGVSSVKTGDVKESELNITPKVGYFATENIAVGATIGYTSLKETNDFGDDQKTTAFGFGVFGRYYATPASDFSFFGELGVNYATAKFDDGIDGTEDGKANGFNVAVAPGVSYFISKHFAFEASIGVLSYGSVKPDADGAEATNSFELGLGLDDLTLGLVYKF